MARAIHKNDFQTVFVSSSCAAVFTSISVPLHASLNFEQADNIIFYLLSETQLNYFVAWNIVYI